MLNPGFGAFELVLVAIIALIVVGPKDLPLLMRRLGQFMARMRVMAAEFRSSFDEMARQAELDELRKEVEAMRRGQFLPPEDKAEVEQVFQEIDQSLALDEAASRVEYAEPASLPPAEPAEPEPAAEPKKRARKPAAAKSAKPKAGKTAGEGAKRARKPRSDKAAQA